MKSTLRHTAWMLALLTAGPLSSASAGHGLGGLVSGLASQAQAIRSAAPAQGLSRATGVANRLSQATQGRTLPLSTQIKNQTLAKVGNANLNPQGALAHVQNVANHSVPAAKGLAAAQIQKLAQGPDAIPGQPIHVGHGGGNGAGVAALIGGIVSGLSACGEGDCGGECMPVACEQMVQAPAMEAGMETEAAANLEAANAQMAPEMMKAPVQMNNQPMAGGMPQMNAPMVNASQQPMMASPMQGSAGPYPAMNRQAPQTPLADLAIVDLRLLDIGDSTKGPAFRVIFRNQGNAPAAPFQVGMIAGLDPNSQNMVHTEKEIPGLKPGQVAAADLRLPLEAMKLATEAGPAPFQMVSVYLDTQGQLNEVSKENNVVTTARNEVRWLTDGK